MGWTNAAQMGAKKFTCGFCSNLVGSDRGYYFNGGGEQKIYVCPHCENPTFFDHQERAFPSPAPGEDVLHVPAELSNMYNEARRCCSVGAYTSAVLACRKMLMNIGVNQGAAEGLSFFAYVEYLAKEGYIPPNGRGWVDHIRKKGNEATHEIALMSQADAMDLIHFTEMLLKFIYEFPSRVPAVPTT